MICTDNGAETGFAIRNHWIERILAKDNEHYTEMRRNISWRE